MKTTKNAGQIGRRRFMHYSAAGLALAASSHVAMEADPEPPSWSTGKTGPERTQADVLVVGGGTAGTIAAIQAARAGAKTVLLERGTQLGGTMTTGGVAFPGLFHAWGKQIIAGIGWELVRESVELDGRDLPVFSKLPQQHWHNQIHINQFLYAILAEEKCERAGVRIIYYEFPWAISKTAKGWQVDCVGFGTQRRVSCQQIVDCTGGAEVVGLLNLPRLRGEEQQPGSMLFQLGEGHDPASAQLHRLYVHGADSTNSRTVTAANLTGRKEVLRKVREQRKRLMHLQPETGFRESYRIEGDTVITVDDYASGRVFDDAVCYAFYPVDLHSRSGVKPEPLTEGTIPTIPLTALVPKRSRNIIVAGRSVSSDRLANSGLRVQAPCMAMGQAAGAAAALAARGNTTPLEVPLKDIRRVLREHGAIIPPTPTFPAGHADSR